MYRMGSLGAYCYETVLQPNTFPAFWNLLEEISQYNGFSSINSI